MFWRKKSDGFEWHKYVRTTIKLRREDRQRRIDELRNAAVEGIAGAGKAGVSASASGFDALLRALAAPFVWLAGKISPLLHAIARMIWPLLQVAMLPFARALERNGVEPLLWLAAVVAGLLAVGRYGVTGWDTIVLTQAAIAALIAAFLLLPPLVTGRGGARVRSAFGTAASALGSAAARIPGFAAVPGVVFRGLGAIAIGSAVAVAGWLALGTVVRLPAPSLASLPGLKSLPGLSGSLVNGRAVALSGDSLRIGRRVVRLAGIDAPEYNQRCGERTGRLGRERRWRCGAAAKQALVDRVRGIEVECRIGSKSGGHAKATCTADGNDLAAELVRKGHVFAEAGLFSTYGRLEQDARNAKLGLWRGAAERPSEYRARLWESAKRKAPDGCPIKGRIASGQRLYVTPWSPSYRRVRVREKSGGRWFCSEEEAIAAGWQPGDRS